MKRVPYAALLVLILASLACGSSVTANPEPTTVPIEPSDSPSPTDTPVPTDTPTPIPTATPDVAATAAVVATESAADVLGELDKLLGDSDVSYKDGHLAWQQTEAVTMNMDGPQGDNIHEIDDTVTAGNFIFKADVTWEASGVLICGAVFRSEPNLLNGKQYQFYFYRLSGLPAYFIDVYEFGEFKNTITDAKFSDGLKIGNGETNQFMLVAQDDQFNVYINGKRQSRFFDYSKQRLDGYFGFLAWQQSGKGRCEFENSWIWSLD